MAEGNRKDPRARVLNMTVRYKSATVDEFIENHSHDISRGGIFIKTRSPFPAGTLLKFEVRIAEDQKLMHGVGRVVWRRDADRAEDSFPAGMGIKFIKTGEGASELINQLIAAREGVESSFDAGVRENVSAPNGGRPSAIPTAPAPPVAPKATITLPPTSAPSLRVETAPRNVSVPVEAETAVTNPAKKRQDQAPEKRKVVLQGRALESPSSRPKPPAVTARPAGSAVDSAPSRKHSRGSIAEETTAPRVLHAAKKNENESPKLGGLIVILALVGLVVFVVNRVRGPGAEPSPTTVSAEPPTPPPAPAVLPPPAVPSAPEPPQAVEAAPAEAQPADPNAVGVEVPAGAEGEPAPSGATAVDPSTSPVAAPSGTILAPPQSPPSQPASTPSPSQPAPSSPITAGEKPAAAPSPPPAAASQAAPAAPPPAAQAPVAPAPSSAPTPPSAAPRAAAPRPAPVAPSPVPPKPRATAPRPPAQAAPPAAKPAEPAPSPPATNGSGGESAGAAPSAKKPAPVPSQPAPPSPAPAPAPPGPSNDNPY